MSLIQNYDSDLKKGVNPRDIKLKLAFGIVKMYHSEVAAHDAQNYFISTFTEKKIPEDLPQFKPSSYKIVSVLVESNLVSSKSEARRIIKQKGIKINGEVIGEEDYIVPHGSVLQKGKMNFLEIL